MRHRACVKKKSKKNSVDIPPHQTCYSWPWENILTPGLDPPQTAVLPYTYSHLLYGPDKEN